MLVAKFKISVYVGSPSPSVVMRIIIYEDDKKTIFETSLKTLKENVQLQRNSSTGKFSKFNITFEAFSDYDTYRKAEVNIRKINFTQEASFYHSALNGISLFTADICVDICADTCAKDFEILEVDIFFTIENDCGI